MVVPIYSRKTKRKEYLMRLKHILITVILVITTVYVFFLHSSFDLPDDGVEATETQTGQNDDASLTNKRIYTEIKDDGLYLINSDVNDGNPLFGPAKEIHIEHQDTCARVKCIDNSWAIISCYSGKVLLDDCSKILELPLVTVIGAAVRNEKVVIFSLPTDSPFEILCETPNYSDVSEVIWNDYVIVEKNGKSGVLYAYNGEEAIPPYYDYINRFCNPYDINITYFICIKSENPIPEIYTLP